MNFTQIFAGNYYLSISLAIERCLMPHRYAQCTLLQTAYGHSAQEDNDPIIDLVEKSSANLVEMVKPGAYLVDFIPVLAKLPRLLPGMTFLDKAEQVKKFATDTRTIPFANGMPVDNSDVPCQ